MREKRLDPSKSARGEVNQYFIDVLVNNCALNKCARGKTSGGSLDCITDPFCSSYRTVGANGSESTEVDIQPTVNTGSGGGHTTVNCTKYNCWKNKSRGGSV
jgi:hypothetical protein